MGASGVKMQQVTASVGGILRSLATILALASASGLGAIGCSSDDPPAEAPAATPAPATEVANSAKSAPGVAPAEDPPPPPTTMLESEVRALLDRWLAAQNAGDFEAYAALYTSPMRGVRRSGERVRRFDREGWLEDRRRMFGAPMRVAASEITLHLSARATEVRFVQDWASGRYHDVGSKRIVVVRQGEALKISLEEMERSELVAAGAPSAMALPDFAFVVEAGGAWVVLDDAPADDLGVGRLHLLSRGEPLAAALRRAERAKVAPTHRALLGTRLALHGAAGPVCEGEVKDLHELRRFIPHFGQVQSWRGEEPEEGPPMPSAEVAAEVWQQGESGRLLVASIDAEGCEGALFARDASAPDVAPRVGRPVDSPDVYVEAARATRAYREQQRAFDGSGPWHRYEGAEAEVRVHGEGAGALVTVRMNAGMGCGDFGGALLQFYRDGASGPERLLDGSAIIDGRPVNVVDLDGDGVDEIIVEEFGPETAVYRRDETGAYRAGTRLHTPYFDCGC